MVEVEEERDELIEDVGNAGVPRDLRGRLISVGPIAHSVLPSVCQHDQAFIIFFIWGCRGENWFVFSFKGEKLSCVSSRPNQGSQAYSSGGAR